MLVSLCRPAQGLLLAEWGVEPGGREGCAIGRLSWQVAGFAVAFLAAGLAGQRATWRVVRTI